MEIYLDANATTPVIAQARRAVLEAMGDIFGNPSSIHSSGLKARDLVETARARARRALGARSGELVFVSGATEAIQTAVLSALADIRAQRECGIGQADLLLYGATEHKAVPEALKHWNGLLGLGMEVAAIPVDASGRHDLDWLRRHAPRAGLVCTMAANNETGVVSDLGGIEQALAGSAARWLVDCVQALGKMDLRLDEYRIDYAAYSGHKLYAPKGIGLLYLRDGAPFTPLLAGGGQESARRSGTENMVGIAGLSAVLGGLADPGTFRPPAALAGCRERLAQALRDAFPGLVFNAPPEICLPTTLNFSVPGLPSRLLLDLFDAAGVAVSGGSACSASQARSSHVLEAMGLPEWRTASAVRVSFGPTADDAFIDEACARIRSCGASLRAGGGPGVAEADAPDGVEELLRFQADGACCYLLCDQASRTCVVFDPLPALVDRIASWMASRDCRLIAALGTGLSGAGNTAFTAMLPARDAADLRGWPPGADGLPIGSRVLARLQAPGGTAYVLQAGERRPFAFVGALAPASLGSFVDADTVLLPSRDLEDRYATTLRAECAGESDAEGGEPIGVDGAVLRDLAARCHELVMVDVREPHERRVGNRPAVGGRVRHEVASLSALPGALSDWLRLPAATPVVFFCRAGNRSARAAQVLRRLGHHEAYSLAGGMALWSQS
jgi:cysteine sulfinate desulfinase/cysteine desulfurase-like protein/rhodanese-related sulfurtransferase